MRLPVIRAVARAVGAAMLLAALTASAGQDVLFEPGPIAVPPRIGLAKVQDVIRNVLVARDWIVRESQPGRLTADYTRRADSGFRATIAINYSAMQVHVAYVDSQGLDYEVDDGERLIHGNYNKWIRNLVKDLTLQLAAAQI